MEQVQYQVGQEYDCHQSVLVPLQEEEDQTHSGAREYCRPDQASEERFLGVRHSREARA